MTRDGGTRFYRALLRLYPASYRAEYGGELCAVFAERARAHAGPLAPLAVGLAAVADVVPNAIAVHWDMLRQDLRYAARSLRRAPGFALTAVVLVALGVGANTAAFSLADFVLVRPLPFPRADRLVKIYQAMPRGGYNELSPANYRDWSAASGQWFEAFGAYWFGEANLIGVNEPRRLALSRVTPNLMPIVGVPALAGRVITPTDSADPAVVVVSHALWQTHFGGASDIIGKVVRLDGAPHVVIGVMPPTFRFPTPRVDAWTPLMLGEEDFADRGNTYLYGLARLRDGVTLEQARDQLAVVSARIEQPYVNENGEVRSTVFGFRYEIGQRARLLVLSLCGAALCILLLACANLASLLLARGAHRARELAVRAALGAGPERLVRQLLTESLVLTALGGAAGVAVAALGVPLLARLVPSTLPIAADPAVDLRVLAAAAVLVGLAGLGFGVAPAVGAGRSSALDALREGARTGGGRTRRLRAALVVAEVAASVVLLIASGLMIRAVWRLQSIDTGVRAEQVLTLRTALPWPKYATLARGEQFYDRVLNEVRALPGVTSAAYTSGLPMRFTGGVQRVPPPSGSTAAADVMFVSFRLVTSQYFEAMGISLRRGRGFAETDRRGQPLVAVVSESFARRQWPNEDPVGKQFTVADSARTVVGVVGDVRVRGRERTTEPQVYLPYKQIPDSVMFGYTPKDLVIRSTAPASALLPAIRQAVRAADPDQPISDVASLEEVLGAETAPRVTQLRLLAVLSAIALLIAGVGVHGLLTFTVSRRARELGVRRALGAQAGSIVALVLREGLGLALAGVAVGVALAYPAARAMAALLAGVRPSDPATIAAAAGLCLATAIVGCLRPAVRAARVDPMTALRAE